MISLKCLDFYNSRGTERVAGGLKRHENERGVWGRNRGMQISIASGILSCLAVTFACATFLIVTAPIRVIDGDTIDRWPLRHRLLGFDAPEIGRARCDSERERGLAAKARLDEMVRGAGRVDLHRRNWALDRYGRALSRLDVDGRDVAEIAISEGWGVRYNGRGPARDWCEE